jgi:hypothetical protein
LHEDDIDRPGNLTDLEYEAAYDAMNGTPCHHIPEDVIAAALAKLDDPNHRGPVGADADRVYTAASIGGYYGEGAPNLLVVHDLEAPVRAGIVWELATGWLQTAGVSPHGMTDNSERVETCPDNRVGFHVRSPGNERSHGEEHCGYASNSLEQWTTGAQWQCLKLGAANMARKSTKLNIPLRWLSIAQIRAGERGLCSHADISLAWGTTDHTDPGKYFPFDAYLRTAQQYQGDYSTGGGGNPNPGGDGGTGGADPSNYIDYLLKRG